MHYFDIPTIKAAIERLQDISPNFLLPSFVLAANGVGSAALVDMSERHGTDQFLKRYFDAGRIGIAPFPVTGNNLLRPRMKGMPDWVKGPYEGDHVIRQDTKLWANLLSSRGYRDMRKEGLLDGDKAIARLTTGFQPRFEQEVPADFHFEDFLVWLFAFEGFDDGIGSWQQLYDHLLKDHLKLDAFPDEFRGRFSPSNPPLPWPPLLSERPDNGTYLHELAPGLEAVLHKAPQEIAPVLDPASLPPLNSDDPILAQVQSAIASGASYSFLLAGPPGTGKTRHARQMAVALTDGDAARTLFLQFHPALGYDDFIEGFRPEKSSDGQGVQYDLKPRLFMSFVAEAAKQRDKTFVVVIDELNRGDVARIFGEVLTYLEPDYRDKTFTLSFSGHPATLPSNLILLATANPFDRSVTDLDDALLRRFWVVEMLPDRALLEKHLTDASVEQSVVNRAMRLFEIMDSALPTGFGHTSLLGVRTVEDLIAVWTGRLRLMLRRTLVADRVAFDSVSASIEALWGSREAAAADEADTG